MQCPSAEPLGPAPLAIALAPALITPLGTELTRKSAKSLHTIAAFVPSACLRRRLVSFLLTSLFLPFLLLSHAQFLGSIMGRMGCKVVAGCVGGRCPGILLAPSQPWGQPGARQERASPAPGGEERDGDRKGRAAPGGRPREVGRAPSSRGQVVPSSLPAGRGHEALLNVAQNKQPPAAGPPALPRKQPACFPGGRGSGGALFPLALFQRSGAAALTRSAQEKRGSPSQGCHQLPWGWGFSCPVSALRGSGVWHCNGFPACSWLWVSLGAVG